MNYAFFGSIMLTLGFTLLLHPFLDLKYLLFAFTPETLFEIYEPSRHENARLISAIDLLTQTLIPLALALIIVYGTQIAKQAHDKAAFYLIAGASSIILCKYLALFQAARMVWNSPITYYDFIGYPLLLIGIFRLLFTLTPRLVIPSEPVIAPSIYAVPLTLGLAYCIAKTLQHTSSVVMPEWLDIALAILIASVLVCATWLHRRIRHSSDVYWIALAIAGAIIVGASGWLPLQFFDLSHYKIVNPLRFVLQTYVVINLISRLMLGAALLHLFLTLAPKSGMRQPENP